MKQDKKNKIWGKNKFEFYLSFLIVLFLIIWAPPLPHDLGNGLITSTFLLVAIICALNALLDFKRMNNWERILGVMWFFVLVYFALIYIYGLTQYRASLRHGG
ncbi:MAG TPA: hypothetical protein VGB77_20405 [Abditibacteriaceae bacterium]|jgi:hypothetical protein